MHASVKYFIQVKSQAKLQDVKLKHGVFGGNSQVVTNDYKENCMWVIPGFFIVVSALNP